MKQETFNGGQVLARVLKEEGVEYIFGVGGGGLFPIMFGCSEVGIKVVEVRHEQAAAFGADAFARCARKPAGIFLFGGPGYTNAANGIAGAFYARSPVVAMIAQHPTLADHRDPSAASWGAEALKTTAKWTVRVVDERLIGYLTKKALIEAATYPCGPVVLEFPENVLVRARTLAEARGWVPGVSARPAGGGGSDPASVEKTVHMLAEAERPIINAGDEVWWSDASEELRTLVELLQCPVITRRSARGAVPEDHPLAFRGRARGAILSKADVSFIAGLRLGYLEDYGRWARGKVIQLSSSQSEISFGINTDVVLLGNVKATLQQMIDYIRAEKIKPRDRSAWLGTVSGLKMAEEQRLAQTANQGNTNRPIHPSFLGKEVVEFLDKDATVIFDAYTASAFLTERLKCQFPGHIIETGMWITIGHGIGMGIGAQLARPGKQILVNMGDGGMGQGGMDVETAVRYKQPAVYLVNNNSSMMSATVEIFYGNQVRNPDGTMCNPFLLTPTRYDTMFSAFGEMGAYTERVEDPQQIKSALFRAFNSGKPAVLDVVVDRFVRHPMVYGDTRGHRWFGPEKMPEEGRRLAYPELYKEATKGRDRGTGDEREDRVL